MSYKNYVTVEAKGAAFRDIPGLGKAVGDLLGFDPMAMDMPPRRLDTFVHVVADGMAEFYQGAAGEDQDDRYGTFLRVYASPSVIARTFADHLTAGRLLLRYAPEGDQPAFWLVEPGRATRLDVL